MVIAHHECNLSLAVGHAVVATYTNKLIGHRGHQRDPINMINMREPVQVSLREFGIGSKEPQIHGLL